MRKDMDMVTYMLPVTPEHALPMALLSIPIGIGIIATVSWLTWWVRKLIAEEARDQARRRTRSQ